MTYQKKWKDKQKQQGKKLITFWLDETLINQVDEMVDFYNHNNRKDFIVSILEKTYETYTAEKNNVKTPDEIIKDILVRIENLENKITKKPTQDKQPTKKKQETSKSVNTDDINYEPDEIRKTIIEMKSQETPSKDIASTLVSRGYTTIKGKQISGDWVDKQYFKYKREGYVWNRITEKGFEGVKIIL